MADRLDHEAIERIVRRAIELDGEADVDEVVGGLDVDSLVAAAAEVGISEEAVLESVALERLGDEPHGHTLDPVFGARWVVAQRRVQGGADEAFERLDDWLTRGHHLRRGERNGTSAVWRRRRDMAAGLQRGIRGFSGGGRLGTLPAIVGHVTGIDGGNSIVRVMVDRSSNRSGHVAVAAVAGTGGVATAATMAMVTPPLALVGVPVVAVAGVASSRSKRAAAGIGSELARLLDHLAEGRDPASAMGVRLPRRRR